MNNQTTAEAIPSICKQRPKLASEVIKQAAYETALRMAALSHRYAVEGKPAVTLECIDRVMKGRLPSLPDDLRLILAQGFYDNYMIGYRSVPKTKEEKHV